MTSPPNQTRKPYDPSAYASLRSGDERASEAPQGLEISTEAERLKALREALWGAFEAGPAAGLPNTLIELTLAYTGSLRLQLNLRALASRTPGQKPKIVTVPRPLGDRS